MTELSRKNSFAKTPPMGWNSYDYYDTTVTEADVKRNADYMAENLKSCGWEYVVVDIEWYSVGAGSQREKFQYIPFADMEMDEFGRLTPDVTRFPSAKDGKGFEPLAAYVHSLGLKFGIHIMRGIPRIAAHLHMPVAGTKGMAKATAKNTEGYITADKIADAYSICPWNPDMYGVNPNEPGAQEYYDSIIKMYAEWGVDFIKCDDIARFDARSAKAEIEMLHKAIMKSGRDIVLSLSPGPAIVEESFFYKQNANMWRITDDFWDRWDLLKNMFIRCERWQEHVSEGCYPDCDMLPLGMLGKGFGAERPTNFTIDEQMTMMSLWCIFKSPMMLGAELPKLDERTLKLITNKDVLDLLSMESQAKQIVRNDDLAIWVQKNYVAVFNLSEEDNIMEVKLDELLEDIVYTHGTELWSGDDISVIDGAFNIGIPKHGAKIIRF